MALLPLLLPPSKLRSLPAQCSHSREASHSVPKRPWPCHLPIETCPSLSPTKKPLHSPFAFFPQAVNSQQVPNPDQFISHFIKSI